ncbi:MAG: HD domain-containing protein [Candidatus Heimdallarchaeota archaeon]|nr:HD domain-containing protein [Candidatus Heimdallarchaeota archaeon]MBY8995472.1 HD domain-containing protein [Candidatus Heimdallarchaeota archaeon]
MQIVDRKKVAEDVLSLIEQQGFKKAKDMWNFLFTDPEIEAAIKAANRLAVKYLKYTDHGLDHVAIVCRNVLEIIAIVKDEITPAFIRQDLGDLDDVAVICLAACYLHDVGHMVHRDFHELSSSYLTKDFLYGKLKKMYPDVDKRMEMLSHIQHAILSHDDEIACLTPEAGFVTIADGLDICEGRSRKPYDLGKVDIHSISALSISRIEIKKGTKKKPLRLNIFMISEAGVFQVEEVFLPKLRTSGLAEEVEINTLVNGKPLALSQVLRMYKKFED